MARYRFLPQAREELAAAVAFYEAESPGIRRRLLRRFPYAILYGMDGDDVLIVVLAHQRRRPDYWLGRP